MKSKKAKEKPKEAKNYKVVLLGKESNEIVWMTCTEVNEFIKSKEKRRWKIRNPKGDVVFRKTFKG